MPTENELRWAEALAIERLHGDDGPCWIAERSAALARVGDVAGTARSAEISLRCAQLSGAGHSPQ